MQIIAVDGQGCHYFMVEISERRYQRKTYMEALYNSIEMVFKKLKYHKGKMDITITEVYDDASGDNRRAVSKGTKQKRAKAVLENDATDKGAHLEHEGISSHYLTDKSGYKGVQEAT